jgi:hypothetical protein
MNTSNIDSIIGFYISGPSLYYDASEELKEIATQKSQLFREYIWGHNGICDKLKVLRHKTYGLDINLILFQFHIEPLQEENRHLRQIEKFRPSEKAIGIPIIINQLNFFGNNETIRLEYLRQVIVERLGLVEKVIKRNKFDTDFIKLKVDTAAILDKHIKERINNGT